MALVKKQYTRCAQPRRRNTSQFLTSLICEIKITSNLGYNRSLIFQCVNYVTDYCLPYIIQLVKADNIAITRSCTSFNYCSVDLREISFLFKAHHSKYISQIPDEVSKCRNFEIRPINRLYVDANYTHMAKLREDLELCSTLPYKAYCSINSKES